MFEPGVARGVDQLGEEGAADSAASRLRPHVDVRYVCGLPAAVAEHAEDEAEQASPLFRDQRGAVAHGDGQVVPRLVPGLAEVWLLVELGLELLPQLAQEIVVCFGRGSDRHR